MDASQTLYEFRSANPKALNALEASGTFATYKLTTNYRSNQDILDFANVHLLDIEANQFARLQLQANNLIQPTAKSFKERVQLKYLQYTRLGDFVDDLPGLIYAQTKGFIDEKLNAGQQVAFLTYTRREVQLIEDTLKELYPGEEINNLVSARSYASTVFSQFIKMYWNDILQLSPQNAAFAVYQEITNNLQNLTKRNYEKTSKDVMKMISDWWIANSNDITGWVNQYQNGQLGKDEFFVKLRDCLLDYEIRHNAIKQSVINEKKREQKEKNANSNAKLIVSTIHGVKGLEFDNTVVVHRYNNLMDEQDKRMYYVALTRAMHSEFILSYGSTKNARIKTDHEMLIAALEERDKKTAMVAAGIDPDDIE